VANFDLEKQASAFARELTELLNKTVCGGIRLRSVISAPGRAMIGYRIDKHNLDATVGIPLTLGPKAPTGYFALSFRLAADRDVRYLMVESSFMGLFLDVDLRQPLLHYDYEREKADGYPEAHLQVCAESESWKQMCAMTRRQIRPFERLHLPVGGRRFRPTLEDLIDFLIAEQAADVRPGAQQAVDDGRERFRMRQLRAAIRNDPGTAIEVLRDHDLLPPH
jgi:hypothetical protein